jgi:hypothetical protein
MSADIQSQLFIAALDEVDANDDLVNQVIELDLKSSRAIGMRRYRLPPD